MRRDTMENRIEELFSELALSDLFWVIRVSGHYTFFTSSVSGYNIDISKQKYSNGDRFKFGISYRDSEREIVPLLDLNMKVETECTDKYSDDLIPIFDEPYYLNEESKEYSAFMSVLKMLDVRFNETTIAVNKVTDDLRKLRINKEEI
jgi:hypothetical protein